MEEWKDIKGFEGYQVSNEGRVRSFYWNREHILNPDVDKDGYLRVVLCNNNRHYKKSIHRLVAEAFNEPVDDIELLTIDHINGDKTDNRPDNLEWVTNSENLKRSHKNGNYVAVHRRQMKPVIVIDTWTDEEKYYDNMTDAAYHTDIPLSTISSNFQKGNESFGRYIIEYADRERRLLYGFEDYQ